MEYKSDLGMAIEAFEDEINGIESYNKMLETVECPELHKIVSKAVDEEKPHAAMLLQWINGKAKDVLN